MSIRHDIRTWLLLQSDVTDIVGTRITAGPPKRKDDYPYLVISNIAGPLEHDLSGANPLAGPTFQLTVFDKDAVVASNAGPTLRDTLANANAAGGFAMGSTTVQAVEVIDVVDLPETGRGDATDKFIFSTAVDIQLWFAT